MNRHFARITLAAAVSFSAFASFATFAGDAHAASNSDFAIWQSNYGTGASAAVEDGDGAVDGRDFLVWRRHTSNTGFTGGVFVAAGDIGSAPANPAELVSVK